MNKMLHDLGFFLIFFFKWDIVPTGHSLPCFPRYNEVFYQWLQKNLVINSQGFCSRPANGGMTSISKPQTSKLRCYINLIFPKLLLMLICVPPPLPKRPTYL